MRLLVIGANGFIGHSLVDHLLEHTDWTVCGIDLESTRLGSALGRPRFSFHRADITQARDLVEGEIRASDAVLPLAAIANPMRYVREPLRVFELVFEENLRVLRWCAHHRVRLVFPSTSEVYGMCADAAFSEATSLPTFGPVMKERWIYASAKHLLERVIWAHGRAGLRFTIFRPFNWFGPNLDDIAVDSDGGARVVTLFLGRLLRGQPLRLVDGGHQTRSFTYISDGVDALVRILANKDNAADGEIFNIGHPGNHCTIADLARRLAAAVAELPGREDLLERIRFEEVSGLEYYGPGYQDIPRRKPDISRIGARLGWEPRVSLDEALRRTVAWYAGDLAAAGSVGRARPR